MNTEQDQNGATSRPAVTISHPIELHDRERVIAVVPEHCWGHGWGNSVAWVYIQDTTDQTLRVECLQPHDFTPALLTLFDVGAVMQKALKEAIVTTQDRQGIL